MSGLNLGHESGRENKADSASGGGTIVEPPRWTQEAQSHDGFVDEGKNPNYSPEDEPSIPGSSSLPALENIGCDNENAYNFQDFPGRTSGGGTAGRRRIVVMDGMDDDDPNDDNTDEPALVRHQLHQHESGRIPRFPGDPSSRIKRLRRTPSSVLEYEHTPLIMEQRLNAKELLTGIKSIHSQIRLLDLAPSSDPTSEIRCTLRHVYIDENPVYKAVSYVWGSPCETLPILVDGKKHRVTTNCHAVLQRIRLEKESVCLWIDSICINQKDLKEKSFQIVLMRDIYSQAEEVFVWLGKPDCTKEQNDEDEEVMAITLIKDLTRSPELFDSPEAFAKAAGAGDAARRWEALAVVFQHPWFHRLWVHQEIIVAKRVRVMGLSYCIAWELIAVAALAIEQHTRYWDPLAENGDNSSTNEIWGKPLKTLIAQVDHLNVLRRWWPQWSYDRDNQQISNVSLLQLLQNTRHYQCTNPLDKCFAIFGLVSTSQVDSFILHPDYELRVNALYTYLAWFIIRGTESLEILCLAGLGNSNETADPKMPSWVVDWREDGIQQPSRLDYGIYNAGACDFSPDMSFDIDELTLTTSCKPAGIVKMVEIHDGGDFWRSTGLRQWHDMFKGWNIYPSKCSPEEAWIRTITCDIGYEKGEERRMSDDLLAKIQTLLNIEKLSCKEIEEAFPKTDPPVDDADWQASVIKVGEDFVRTASRATNSRAFFITHNGYMGIGPRNMRKEDVICRFPGCRVPLLVRSERHGEIQDRDAGTDIAGNEQSIRHFIVGECFVWGLMNRKIDPFWELKEYTFW